MENKQKYLVKIKKLLALAKKNTNAHEAASAMRQAQNLMHEHNLSATDVDLMEICEASSSGAPTNAENIPKYMGTLAWVICQAFGVRCYYTYQSGYLYTPKRIVTFYGPNERPQVAAYSFDVLSRQMMKARAEYRATLRKSIKASTKIARADTFCESWVYGAYCLINDFAVSEAEETLIAAYNNKLQQEAGLQSGELREAKSCRGADDAASAGYQAGKAAQLNHAVNGAAGNNPPLQIGG